MATRNEFLPDALFKFDNLYSCSVGGVICGAIALVIYVWAIKEGYVQKHLKNVYGTLGIGMLAAAAGAYVHLFTNIMQAGLLTAFGSLGLMLWLASIHHSKETQGKRLAIFTGFTFLSGISLGPLLDMAIMIDPSIIPSALLGTAVIFISFTLAALYNTNRTFLYLGGFILSGLSFLLIISIANIFFRSQMLFDINLYGGLVIFCAFVLYDTQLIIEKRRMGDDDFVWHSVDLFIDFIQIFRRLLIILSRKEEDKKRRRN